MHYPFTWAETIFVVMPIIGVQIIIFLFLLKIVDRKWMGYCIPVIIFVSAYLFWKGGVFSNLGV